jgi:hypothetical protein
MEGVGFRESLVIRWINGRQGERYLLYNRLQKGNSSAQQNPGARAMRAGDPDVMSGDSSD